METSLVQEGSWTNPSRSLKSECSSAILVEDLTVRFRNISDRSVLAVDQVSFSLQPGEFVSPVGPSGCGKTTILNVITGLLAEQPTGKARVLDRVPFVGNPDIAYMLARDSLLPWRTALGNVAYGMELRA